LFLRIFLKAKLELRTISLEMRKFVNAQVHPRLLRTKTCGKWRKYGRRLGHRRLKASPRQEA
jgi:hypothetical protein